MTRFEPRWQPGWNPDSQPFDQQKEEPRHPTTFDVISKVLLPLALAANAYVSRANPYLLGLFTLAVLLVIFFPHLRGWIKSKSNVAHDRRVIAQNIKRLRQFSREVEEFLDPS